MYNIIKFKKVYYIKICDAFGGGKSFDKCGMEAEIKRIWESNFRKKKNDIYYIKIYFY